MFDYGGNFFSESLGYVIDGMTFESSDVAAEYLVRDCCMEATEAWSFINGLRRAFIQRSMTAKEA